MVHNFGQRRINLIPTIRKPSPDNDRFLSEEILFGEDILKIIKSPAAERSSGPWPLSPP